MLRSTALLLALAIGCTPGGERDPVAPASEPVASAPHPAHTPVISRPYGPERLHPATTTAALYGLTGDDAGLVLAVGVGGTIVRSDDRGGTWGELAAPTTNKLMAAWRGPTGTLFAVGDAGTIVRSRDRGLTWELCGSGVTADLAHVTGNAAEVVAAGAGGTIVRSQDDGETWAPVAMPSLPAKAPPVLSRRIHDRDAPPPTPSDTDVLRGMFRGDEPILGLGAPRPGELFIALRRLVWQRADERGEWKPVARADGPRDRFGELWVGETHWAVTGRNASRERPRYFVGVGATGPAGDVSRWSQLDSRLIGEPEIVGAPRPGQPPIFYAAGDGYAVHWSEDGGSTWDGSEQSAVMQSPYPLAKRALWVAPDGVLFAAGTAGAVMRSSDQARTWSVLNGGSREPLFGGALGPDGSILAAVSHALLRGRGSRWELLSPRSRQPTGGGEQADTSRGLARCCTDVWVAPDGAIVAAGSGLFWRSTDDGRTWAKVHDDDPRWDCCGSLWGDRRGVFGVGRDVVLASVDHGKTWTRHSFAELMRPEDRQRLDISGRLEDLLLVGEAGAILHSGDRGRTWARRTAPTHEPLYAGHITVTRAGGPLFLAVGEHGTVLRSTDAVAWESIATPTTGRLLGVHGDIPRNELYVVGEPGLLRSRDDGRTWTLDPTVPGPLRNVFGDGFGAAIATGERGEVLRLPWQL